ncbi:MAG: hypothetical protein IIB07_00560 [Bacteroidetes bacterium]|nr:hypothetical protein [Bacteroidota bacterium]
MNKIYNRFSSNKIFSATLFLLIISCSVVTAQSNNPNEIIENLKSEFERVKDYKADVSIKIDASMLKVPKMNVVFYFKQPDKTHIESTSFAMIPKQGVNFSPVSFLSGKYNLIFARKENIDGRELTVIKIIPLNEDSGVLLTTIWVDQVKKVIRKLESTTKTSGTFNIDFNYDEKMEYPLPSKIIFSFNLDKMGLPQNQKDKSKRRRRRISGIKGKVILTYSNYKVNTDLPDTLFEKKKIE